MPALIPLDNMSDPTTVETVTPLKVPDETSLVTKVSPRKRRLEFCRWRPNTGRWADVLLITLLIASFLATFSVPILRKHGLHRGIVAFVTGLVIQTALCVGLYWLARIMPAVRGRLESIPSEKNLDGLWLPRWARISFWLVAVGLTIMLAYLAYSAPHLSTPSQLAELGDAYQKKAEEIPATPENAEEIGKNGLLGDVLKDSGRFPENPAADGDLGGAVSFPSDGSESGRILVDEGSDPGPDNPPWGYVSPDLQFTNRQAVIIKESTRKHTKDNFIVDGFGFPLPLVLRLLGFGTSTEYRTEILKTMATMVQGRVLSPEALAQRLREVPPQNLDRWQEDMLKLIDLATAEKYYSAADAETFKKNVRQAIADAKRGVSEEEELQKLENVFNQSVGNDNTLEQVASDIKGNLKQGKWPRPDFKEKFRVRIQSRLESVKFESQWKAITNAIPE